MRFKDWSKIRKKYLEEEIAKNICLKNKDSFSFDSQSIA